MSDQNGTEIVEMPAHENTALAVQGEMESALSAVLAARSVDTEMDEWDTLMDESGEVAPLNIESVLS